MTCMVLVLNGYSEHVANMWQWIGFSRKKIIFVTALDLNKLRLNRLNNRDHSTRAHLFLNYYLIIITMVWPNKKKELEILFLDPDPKFFKYIFINNNNFYNILYILDCNSEMWNFICLRHLFTSAADDNTWPAFLRSVS